MKAKLLIILFLLNGALSYFYSQRFSYYTVTHKYESLNFSRDKSYSFSRFMKIFSASGIDNYSSPSAIYMIEEIPYNLFPLNLHSPDLMPLDKANYYRFDTRKFDISPLVFSDAENNVNLYEHEIPEHFYVDLNAYIGSETGDPLIHLYTKPDDPAMNNNINKFVPSGLLTISDKINENDYYRISAGYYGYYITGSNIDKTLLRLNSSFYTKQNKQMYTGLDFVHEYFKGKALKFSSHFMNYYGWDFPPFIGEPVHFENYALSSKLDITHNLNYSLVLKNDLVLNDIHNTNFFNGAKTFYSETSFYPAYMIGGDGREFYFSGAVSYLTASNKQAAGQQQYLSKELKKLRGNIAFNTGIELSRNFKAGFSAKYSKHYNDENYFTYNAMLMYQKNYSSFGVKYYSDIKAPNFNELYGRFNYAYSDTSYLFPEQYYISGNDNLKAERDNTYSLFYKATEFRGSYMFKADIFYKNIKDQIGKAPAGVNSYTYINYAEGDVFGGNVEALISFSEWGKIETVYNYLDNKDFIHASKHTLFSQFVYITNFNSEISLAAKYKSKQDWSRQHAFLLPAENIIPESAVFNIYYEQNIKDFYFFRQLAFKIEVENIFDKTYKNIPKENCLRRAVIFYLNTSI